MKKPVCTISLAAVNVIVFLGLSFLGMTEDAGFMLEHGAMYVPYVVEYKEYYRIFTSMFLHFGFQHLMNNMVMLLVIGITLEREIGKIKFLLIYFVSGLGGTMLSMWHAVFTGNYAVAAGASGAIFGLMGAMLYIAARNHGCVGQISGRGLLFSVVVSLYLGYTGGGVDNFAHIGGALAGGVMAVLLYRKRKREYCFNSRN